MKKNEEGDVVVEEQDTIGVGTSAELEIERKLLFKEEKERLSAIFVQLDDILGTIKRNSDIAIDEAIRRIDMLREKV